MKKKKNRTKAIDTLHFSMIKGQKPRHKRQRQWEGQAETLHIFVRVHDIYCNPKSYKPNPLEKLVI